MSTIPYRPDVSPFAEALERGERPRIEDWLPVSEGRTERLAELVALELDHHVRSGEPTTAADYFDRFPELAADPASALRIVQVELRAARRRDPDLTEASFRERYPELARHPEWSDNQLVTTPQVGTTPFQPSGETKPDGAAAGPADPMAFLRGILRPPERPGDLGRFGEFHIAKVLGAGGMGVVLEAHDATLQRRVALKLMRPDVAAHATSRERFLREARAMAAVEHPRIVIVHRVGEWEGIPYLVMPLMAGQSLARKLRDGALLPGDAVRFAREAADGLAAAHAANVIHRDVKPDNIWLEDTAEGTHVRLLDFGLARDDGAEPLTQSGAIFGTPAYMAPEQAAGEKVDGRADLFSLGCVLYEAATGRRAFAGPSLTAILFALANHVPPAATTVNPAVPAAVSDLCERLLQKDRERRPGTAADVAAALRAIERGDPNATVTWRPNARPTRPRSLTVGCSVTITLSLLLGVGYLSGVFEDSRARPYAQNHQELPGAADRKLPDPPDAIDRKLPDPPELAIKPKTPVPPPVAVRELLAVKSLEIRHYAPGPDGDAFKGTLGRTSFAPRRGDKVQILAKLSRPAYAYLLAFRPDGEIELCDPDSDDAVPKLTDAPRYPPENLKKSYGLAEGSGLWIFAVVASDEPLPSFREWKQKPTWKPETVLPGTVWWYDGLRPEPRHENPGTTRGKNEDLIVKGTEAAVVALGDQLKAGQPRRTVGVLGFGVHPKE